MINGTAKSRYLHAGKRKPKPSGNIDANDDYCDPMPKKHFGATEDRSSTIVYIHNYLSKDSSSATFYPNK